MVEVVGGLHQTCQQSWASPPAQTEDLLLDLRWRPASRPGPVRVPTRRAAFLHGPLVVVALRARSSLDAQWCFSTWPDRYSFVGTHLALRRDRRPPRTEPPLRPCVTGRPFAAWPRAVVVARPRHWRRVPGPQRDKAPRRRHPHLGMRGGACRKKVRRRPTLPGGHPPSTIGAGGLHCRVRNGNGCFPAAEVTGTSCGSQRQFENPRASTSQEQEDPKPSAD